MLPPRSTCLFSCRILVSTQPHMLAVMPLSSFVSFHCHRQSVRPLDLASKCLDDGSLDVGAPGVTARRHVTSSQRTRGCRVAGKLLNRQQPRFVGSWMELACKLPRNERMAALEGMGVSHRAWKPDRSDRFVAAGRIVPAKTQSPS